MEREHRRGDGANRLDSVDGSGRSPGRRTRVDAVQRRRRPGAAETSDVLETAESGVEGGGSELPHIDRIQASFGRHDVGGVRAFVGGTAGEAADRIGAEAYATGDAVAFRGAPDLHTAAHEAAHVVQQRGGVQLKGGVGSAGDEYERHADAVADKVVAGESAEALLDQRGGGVGGGAVGGGAVQKRDAARERDSAGGELDRRTGGASAEEDGSGAWGAEADDRGLTDRANHYMWTRVALAAETMGLTNAARHMRHYLGNTGSPLTVSVDNMMRDVPKLAEAYQRELETAKSAANARVAAMGDTVRADAFELTGERKSDVYCEKSVSQDWFFAVGGFTYWYTAQVTVTPREGQPPLVSMVFTLHVFDRYNWDQGKAVAIAGITVRDDQLGRLHRVGLAREYDINGTSTARTVQWDYTGATPPPGPSTPTGGDRDGGRSDPGRDRGRHFDNVRGSEGSNR